MWIVAQMNVRNLHQRIGVALVMVLGTCAAATILVSAIAMLMTFENALRATAKLNRAIVLSNRAFGEFESSLPRNVIAVIADAPGIRRTPDGKPLSSAEVTVGVRLPRRDGRRGFSLIRGIAPDALAMRAEIKLTSGRIYRPAVRELIVSARAREQFKDLEIGERVRRDAQ